MKIVVWGCSQYILNILMKNKHILLNLDFTDGDRNKWNTEIMPGKTIFPLENISANEYTYCLIGSERFAEEIEENCYAHGFKRWQIIPVSYIIGQYAKWKKQFI